MEVRILLKVDQYEFIRAGHRVYKKSIKKLARETGHSINTIRKILKGECEGYQDRKTQPHRVLGEFIEIIEKWLIADKEVPKKQRHTARRIYNRLVESYGFNGSESTVRTFVKKTKARLGINSSGVFIPLDPESAIEAEIDWGNAIAIIGGERRRLKLFCMRSKYSGKPFVKLYPCERQQVFFDAHVHGFNFFGGVFPVIIYDNLTTAVKKVLLGKERIEQESFVKFRAFFCFEARFCNIGEGHEKGGVEGLVGFARRNYMVPIPEADSLEELNDRLLKSCLSYGEHTIDGRNNTVNQLYEKEKGALISLPVPGFSNIQVLKRKADKYSTVRVDQIKYSVPTEYAGFSLRILLYATYIEIHSGTKKIATHQRVYGNDRWCLDPLHYLDLIEKRPMAFNSARPIREWRKSWSPNLEILLKRFCDGFGRSRGVREFILLLLLYKENSKEDMEAIIDLGVQTGLKDASAIKSLLTYSNSNDVVQTALKGWDSTPSADTSVYGILGGVN